MTIAETIYTPSGRRIALPAGQTGYNLGAGRQKYAGVIAVDVLPYETVDIVCDLNKTPWPITDNSADVIFAFHWLEHVDDIISVMQEIHRIGKRGSRLIVEVPYFRHVGAFQDPTHKRFFTSDTMMYFCPNPKKGRETGSYTDVVFYQIDFWFGWPAGAKSLAGKPVQLLSVGFRKLMRKMPKFYDSVISKLLPVKVIVYELEIIK